MKDWIEKNSEAFERDLLWDYCLASRSLGQQVRRFAASGEVSFSIIQSLVGEPLNKGLLWRLKDKAHHIFLKSGHPAPSGPLLDWTLGYIFHESLKLMEDAHQRQYYTPHEAGRMPWVEEPLLAELLSELAQIQGQTRESIRREAARIEMLLFLSRKLFGMYFKGRNDHKPLARFLNDNEALVRQAFSEEYQQFMEAVYGREPERMFTLAAQSLLESARPDAAARALERALACNPACEDIPAIQRELEKHQAGITAGDAFFSDPASC